MRVVHVVRQFSPSVGGLEDAALQLARHQRHALGLDASVVTLDRVFSDADRATLPTRDLVDGVPVARIAWRGSTRYPLAPGVLGTIAGADLVHVHAIDFFFDFLALTRPLHRKPLVVSTHGGFFHSDYAGMLKRVWFATVTRASCLAYGRVIACSRADADMFRPLASRRLATVENGIDLTKFADAAASSPTRTILSFGRFARHKRIDRLFGVLASLRRRAPDWRLIVAGQDADTTAAELARAAAAAGVADAVRFVIAPDNATLRGLMRTASYYASASSHEGFGLAAVEAMSAGLVPILSPIAPFRRLLDGTGVGLIVDADAPDEAARAIATLDEAVRRDPAASRTAAIAAAQPYDWADASRRYAAIYDEVLRSGRRDVAPLAGARTPAPTLRRG